MITFKFNFEKAVQAAGVVLRLHHGRMEYLRLLKILYIADRELLAETGRTLTGDRAVAMKNGPVLSEVYDLLKGQAARAGEWDAAIRTEKYEVVLREPVPVGKLTKAEANKLTQLCDRYRDTNSYDLSELTHDFAEWAEKFDAKCPNPPQSIAWETALTGQGRAYLIGEVVQRLRDRESAAAAFGE